jgi:hypothetical protein
MEQHGRDELALLVVHQSLEHINARSASPSGLHDEADWQRYVLRTDLTMQLPQSRYQHKPGGGVYWIAITTGGLLSPATEMITWTVFPSGAPFSTTAFIW